MLSQISMPVIGALNSGLSGLLLSHPSLAHEVTNLGLSHSMYSHTRLGKKSGRSRRQRRKMANKRRRWFIDNVIMHHRRLHDKNRESAVNQARERALAKREAMKKEQALLEKAKLEKTKDDSMKWRERTVRERGLTLREKVHIKRQRSKSRWATSFDGDQES